jgi:hypothetical protein
MSLTPELLSAIRSLLIGLGGFGVGAGWFTSADLGKVSDAVVTIVVFGVAVWGVWAKRPQSTEARMIAGKVEVNPNTQPIVPPSPADKIVEEKKL